MNATTTTTALLSTAAANLGSDLGKMREKTVAAENAATPTSRSLLAALVSGVMTEATATAAIIHAFGNPKGKKGKPIDTLSGLRNITGGDAVRKMAETCFAIAVNIDADKTEGYEPAIRPLVVAYILNEKDAPKSLRALFEGFKSALRAHAKATQPEAAPADGEGEGEGDAPKDSQSLSDRVLSLMVAFEVASDADKVAAYDAIAAFIDLADSDAAIAAHAATLQPELQQAA